jgi:hypothetical protein
MTVSPDQNGQSAIVIEVPQYGITVTDDQQGNSFIGIHIEQSGSAHDFFLCMPNQVQEVARKFHQMILEAGREAAKRRGKANLVVPKGVNSDALRVEKSRITSGKGRPRT